MLHRADLISKKKQATVRERTIASLTTGNLSTIAFQVILDNLYSLPVHFLLLSDQID